MSVYERILKEIHNGMTLYTPVFRNEFKVKSVDVDKVVFFAGKTNIQVSKRCWDRIPDFLKKQGGWVKIGALHEITEKVEIGTLERFLGECDKRQTSAGCYVASLLEYLKIVEVDHNRLFKDKIDKNL